MAERSGEFSIIDRFFSSGSAAGPWFCKGIGDDCAIIDFGDSRIAVTIDMLAMGTHFLPDADPRNVGYKTLAVNLSDLAAVTGEHSPAVFSITAMGDLPPGLGLTRAGAKPGDDIWVSGTLGDAYAALKYRWGHWAAAPEAVRLMSRRMDRPEPRNALGRALLPLATAAIDVSDGFSQDLTHIPERSHAGMTCRGPKP